MDLHQLIAQLLESGIVENQELGVTLLNSPDVPKEEKKKYIDEFIEDYTGGKIDFFSDEQKNIFKNWVEVYNNTMKQNDDNR